MSEDDGWGHLERELTLLKEEHERRIEAINRDDKVRLMMVVAVIVMTVLLTLIPGFL